MDFKSRLRQIFFKIFQLDSTKEFLTFQNACKYYYRTPRAFELRKDISRSFSQLRNNPCHVDMFT